MTTGLTLVLWTTTEELVKAKTGESTIYAWTNDIKSDNAIWKIAVPVDACVIDASTDGEIEINLKHVNTASSKISTAQKCPVCNGHGNVNWGKQECKACEGKGYLLIPN